MLNRVINALRNRSTTETRTLNLQPQVEPEGEPSTLNLQVEVEVEVEGYRPAVEPAIVAIAPVEEAVTHTIYTGHRTQGTRLALWGRCSCGATLRNKEELDTHRREVGIPV